MRPETISISSKTKPSVGAVPAMSYPLRQNFGYLLGSFEKSPFDKRELRGDIKSTSKRFIRPFAPH